MPDGPSFERVQPPLWAELAAGAAPCSLELAGGGGTVASAEVSMLASSGGAASSGGGAASGVLVPASALESAASESKAVALGVPQPVGAS